MKKKQRILIVDDEEQLVAVLKIRLEINEYIVSVAYDGEEALRKAKAEMPDLIILDLMLPKIDGYMVCSLLKKDPKCSNIPIVLFSAREGIEDIELGGKVGANAYVPKPLGSEILLDKIKELLGKFH